VVARVRWRLERLGLAGVTVTDEDADPLAHESQALAGLSEAAVLGRAALGRRAGRGPLRIGADPDAPWVERRPPLGQQRWQRLRDGRIAVALQRRWADGTTHLVFTPDELLERLVPLVPRPRINLPSITESWRRTRRGARRWWCAEGRGARQPQPTQARARRRSRISRLTRRSPVAPARSTAPGPSSCTGHSKRTSSRVPGAGAAWSCWRRSRIPR